jgi:hypothetical protein
LDYKKQTILILIFGALFSITWINVRLVGTYAQIVPSIQSPPTSEETSTNNSAASAPFSLPSFKLDKNNSVAIAKSGPVAVAGPDQIVNEGSTVTLNGTESRDPNGIILSYSWKQIPTTHFITLSGADTPVWSFTAPRVSADTLLRFELAVTDNNGSTDSSSVNVLVKHSLSSTAMQQQPVERTNIPTNQQTPTANNPPVAGIVPQQSPSTAIQQQPIQQQPIQQQPIQQQPIESTNTSITNTSANNPPVAGIVPQQSPSTAIQQQPIESTSIPTNTLSNGSTTTNTGGPLVANAGQDKTIQSGASVTLDGTDSSGPIISYSWKQISGKSVKLSDANIARSTFVAPIANKDLSLKFKLTVDDSIGRTSTATVNVFVAKR